MWSLPLYTMYTLIHVHFSSYKVMDLEARLDQAQEDLKSGVRPGREKGAPGSERILPRAPAKAVLAGHRNPVTCVALHPLYSVVASSSEDATVKVFCCLRCCLYIVVCMCMYICVWFVFSLVLIAFLFARPL